MENNVSYADVEDIWFRLECAVCCLTLVHNEATDQAGEDNLQTNALYSVILQIRNLNDELKGLVDQMIKARKEQQ